MKVNKIYSQCKEKKMKVCVCVSVVEAEMEGSVWVRQALWRQGRGRVYKAGVTLYVLGRVCVCSTGKTLCQGPSTQPFICVFIYLYIYFIPLAFLVSCAGGSKALSSVSCRIYRVSNVTCASN